MTGSEFLRLVRRLARRRGLECTVDAWHGKGSHAFLRLGARKTLLKDQKKEIEEGLLHAMCAQLGIRKKDLLEG